MSEKRQIPRWQLGKYSTIALDSHKWKGDCCIEDMNLKGMRISLDERLPADTLLTMTVALEDELNFDAHVRICWDKQEDDRFYYGIEFKKMPDRHRDQIDQFLNDNCFDQFQEKWWSE